MSLVFASQNANVHSGKPHRAKWRNNDTFSWLF